VPEGGEPLVDVTTVVGRPTPQREEADT
jgi:hypothetical protein